MAEDKKKYDVFKGLLNGNQVNTLSDEILIKEVQTKTCEQLNGSSQVYVLHDPCDIGKPSAPAMEHIGKVMSLSKTVVNGYRTFNSVAIDPDKQGVNFLSHTIYSTNMPNYVKQDVLEKINEADAHIQQMVEKGEHINTSIIFKKHLKESKDVLKKNNPDVKITHVLDREFDNEDFFETITEQEDHFIARIKLSRLSNNTKICYTAKGKISKRKTFQKLVDKEFKNRGEYIIEKLNIKGKIYPDVRCVLEWEPIELNQKEYSVVRITLWVGNKTLFDHPMLLITNNKINTLEEGRSIYKGYILRFKIEVVFRFLKQNLGWEDFQVRDFESIKNLLAIAFFLVGYFKELEEELKQHPLALFLCDLALSKGKITLFYLLEGLTKVANFQEVSKWMIENNISKEELDQLVQQIQGTDGLLRSL